MCFSFSKLLNIEKKNVCSSSQQKYIIFRNEFIINIAFFNSN